MKRISWLLPLLFCPALMADSLIALTGRRAFLSDLNLRVTGNYGINQAHIHFLQSCLEQMTDEQFEKSVPRKEAKPWQSCIDGVAQVRENTRLNYPAMRRNLLLSQLLTGPALDYILVYYENNLRRMRDSQPLETIAISSAATGFFSQELVIHNPLATSDLGLSEELPNPQWTEAEIRDVLDVPDGSGLDSFNKLFPAGFDRFTPVNRGWGQIELTFQADTKLRYSDKTKGINLNFEGDTAKKLGNIYYQVELARSVAHDGLRAQQKRIESRFMQIVQFNPYVALVTSATPSRKELAGAFKVMAARADKNVKDHKQLRDKFKLDDPKLADESALLGLMANTPVARSLINKPGPELQRVMNLMPGAIDTQAIFDQLTHDYNYNEIVNTGINVAELVALNALVCWIPIEKGPAIGVRVVRMVVQVDRIAKLFTAAKIGEMAEQALTPWCFPISGVAMNVGFWYSSVGDYNEVYNQVFGSAQEEQLMREVSALSEKDQEIFWSMVTIPLGTGIFKALKGPASSFSSKLWNKATAVSERLKGESL